ncbi:MAG TPA: S8 family serine peptidase [Acidimicrobiales bacterium]|nr:S8 family serine peptidase [Acidimicrobiales bacterium]
MRTGAARRVAGAAAVLALVTALVVHTAAAAAGPAGPNDPLFTKQWGLSAIGAPEAWTTTTGAGVVIGVVDTGADLRHEDLAGQVVLSTDCVGSGGNPLACEATGGDDNGHGTAVAGVAAAAAGNNAGVAGAAPGARLLVAKALDRDGKGSIADINAAIQWVVGHGAAVVNLSLGDPTLSFSAQYGESLRQGIEYAWSQGAIPVLAAGNAASLGLPATYSADLDAVVVGATNRTGTQTTSTASTGDAKWAVMAPGGSADGVQADDIVSTAWSPSQHNSYAYASGTAMAAPLVSGTLALLLSAGLSPKQAVDRLLATAQSPVACGTGSATCKGIVDAADAVSGLHPEATTTTQAPASPSFAPATPTSGAAVAPAAAPRPAPAPLPAPKAPAAVMRPAPHAPPAAPGPTVASRARAGAEAAAPPAPVVAVAATRHGRGADIAWAAALAAVFALLVGAGVVRAMRDHE